MINNARDYVAFMRAPAEGALFDLDCARRVKGAKGLRLDGAKCR